MAMFLIERGANPNLAAERQRRHAALGRRQHAVAAAHALPAAAGDGAAEGDLSRRDEGAARRRAPIPNARHQVASLVSRLQRLRQPQLRPRRHLRLDRVLARGLRHRPRGDEAARRVRRRSRTSRRSRRSSRRCARGRRRRPPAGAGGAIAPTADANQAKFNAPPIPARRSRRAARFTPPPASSTAKASPATPIATRRTRWMAVMKYLVEELHADVNARDNDGYTPLHHAAARGDNEMIMYLVSQGRRRHRRRAQRPDDGRHGERPGAARLADSRRPSRCSRSSASKNSHQCVSC